MNEIEILKQQLDKEIEYSKCLEENARKLLIAVKEKNSKQIGTCLNGFRILLGNNT